MTAIDSPLFSTISLEVPNPGGPSKPEKSEGPSEPEKSEGSEESEGPSKPKESEKPVKQSSSLDKQVKHYPEIIKILILFGIISAINQSLRKYDDTKSGLSEFCAVVFSFSAIIAEFSTALTALLIFGYPSLSDGEKGLRTLLIHWAPVAGVALSGAGLIVGEIAWYSLGHSDAWILLVVGVFLAVSWAALIMWTCTSRKLTRFRDHLNSRLT
ncbi:hypothetical protein GGI35DRAFT_484411 [Trichoderma velutinum]